ncbi:hypothetical protein FYK55_25715 [Roseiconus nitratireducens]|uniref:Uncharacterized protein n=1 Tax=Roseiconus nitratireducens TaxID=2605748 RepID=A0A5M6CUS0_9BACT|nr:hypothetical protein FYK55_25715 [Roseiconus nitratireducens]
MKHVLSASVPVNLETADSMDVAHLIEKGNGHITSQRLASVGLEQSNRFKSFTNLTADFQAPVRYQLPESPVGKTNALTDDLLVGQTQLFADEVFRSGVFIESGGIVLGGRLQRFLSDVLKELVAVHEGGLGWWKRVPVAGTLGCV